MHGRSCPELGDQDGHQTKQQPLEPQDYAVEMANELFQVRKLIWEELQQHAKPSEVLELRTAIGNQLIDENEVSCFLSVMLFAACSHSAHAPRSYARSFLCLWRSWPSSSKPTMPFECVLHALISMNPVD